MLLDESFPYRFLLIMYEQARFEVWDTTAEDLYFQTEFMRFPLWPACIIFSAFKILLYLLFFLPSKYYSI
jgi:hypothetical protein